MIISSKVDMNTLSLGRQSHRDFSVFYDGEK
jgi:hypothetical protein